MTEDRKISVLIVDDEPHAREGLQKALENFPRIDVLALCQNGLEAVKRVNELSPDALFLDIQMPKLDGFDVIELLGQQTPHVIFVTAFDEYAVRAFEANAIDYLLKPLNPDRLSAAVERLSERVSRSEPAAKAMHTELLDTVRDSEQLQRILVRDGSEVHVLPVGDVCYIEAADDYVAIHTEGATHIKLESLSRLEQHLDPRQFCRIHRSVILNIAYLARIETESKDQRVAVLHSGKQLPISRSGFARLREYL